MSAEPLSQPEPVHLGHPVRYPIRVDDVRRATCSCHWWTKLDDEQAEAAKR